MTTEQSAVYRAAIAYANLANEEHLGELITAVMDLPMEQWPENACAVKGTPELAMALVSAPDGGMIEVRDY